MELFVVLMGKPIDKFFGIPGEVSIENLLKKSYQKFSEFVVEYLEETVVE